MKTKLEDRTKKRKYLQDNIKQIAKGRNRKENINRKIDINRKII